MSSLFCIFKQFFFPHGKIKHRALQMLGKDPTHLAPLPGVSASLWISAKSDCARGRHGSRAHCEGRWHHDNEAQANPASAERSAANMSGSLTWRVCRPMAGSQGCTSPGGLAWLLPVQSTKQWHTASPKGGWGLLLELFHEQGTSPGTLTPWYHPCS